MRSLGQEASGRARISTAWAALDSGQIPSEGPTCPPRKLLPPLKGHQSQSKGAIRLHRVGFPTRQSSPGRHRRLAAAVSYLRNKRNGPSLHRTNCPKGST